MSNVAAVTTATTYIGDVPFARNMALIVVFVCYPSYIIVELAFNHQEYHAIPIFGHKWIDWATRIGCIILSMTIMTLMIRRFFITVMMSATFFAMATLYWWSHPWRKPRNEYLRGLTIYFFAFAALLPLIDAFMWNHW